MSAEVNKAFPLRLFEGVLDAVMTSHTSDTETPAGRFPLVVATALTLTVAAGMAAWQVVGQDGAASTPLPSRTVTASPVPREAATPADHSRTIYAVDSDQSRAIYLVASEAEAAQINGYWSALIAGNALEPWPMPEVLAVRSDEEAALIQRASDDMNIELGVASVRVVDRRRR